MGNLKLEIGDKIKTKKSHPCGNDIFIIRRAGMDFRIECMKCGRQVWLERPKLEKSIKKIVE